VAQTARSLFSFVKRIVVSIVSSLKATLVSLGAAMRQRSLSRLLDLLKEGSPLEDLIDSVLVAVFWVLLLAPVLLVPLYYLALSVMPR
jgi:hypothetical protein